MNKRGIALIIVVIIAIVFISYGVFLYVIPKPADVRILDFNAEHTGGLIFTLHYVVSGHVINDIQLALVITNNQTGGVLYQTTFSPLPAILAPNEEATFSTPFSTDDLGGYAGPINYAVRVISQ